MINASEYILNEIGNRNFERSVKLNDMESIKDFMNDFASYYANKKLDYAAIEAEDFSFKTTEQGILVQSIIALKDKI